MKVCGKCGETFRWEKRGRRWIGFNADGSIHWETCRRKQQGQQMTITPKAPITGANYTPACGRCDRLPWEECDCSKLLEEKLELGGQA